MRSRVKQAQVSTLRHVMTQLLRGSNFPPISSATSIPNGLLAYGGELRIDTLLTAYSQGIFPWYSEGQPVLWWSPNPRCVIEPHAIHISRSLKKRLAANSFQIRIDSDFSRVVQACASPRARRASTWITKEMMDAYIQLHEIGFAHSVETWQAEQLVGG